MTGYLVACETFIDPTDGQLVEADYTYVAPGADIARMFPHRFRRVTRTAPSSPERIDRIGGMSGIGREKTKQRTPRRPVWQLGPDPRSYRDVELREHYVDFKVSIGSTAREAILEEIKRAHRAAGKAVEAGGWLFGWHRPRAETNSSEIALITRSTERGGDRTTVYLSDPFEALASVRVDYPRMEILGDWHSHVFRGSELPSRADAIAWSGTMDKLARDAYVSVIVSPSAEQGWMFPRFSAWVAGRHGVPSQPLVGRARIAA